LFYLKQVLNICFIISFGVDIYCDVFTNILATLLELLLPCIFDFLSMLSCSGEGEELGGLLKADNLIAIVCW